MTNNNLTDERLSALIRVARDSLELYEMELPVIDDVMQALSELQLRRAAMLQSFGNSEQLEHVTTTNKLPFEQWLSQQDEPIDVDCGCVTTEAFYHWLRVAYEVGNSPVIPEGYVLVPKEPTEEMNKAGWAAMNEHDAINPTYRAMLAAAPQQEAE